MLCTDKLPSSFSYIPRLNWETQELFLKLKPADIKELKRWKIAHKNVRKLPLTAMCGKELTSGIVKSIWSDQGETWALP